MSNDDSSPQPGDGCILTIFKVFSPFSDWSPTPSNLQRWLTGDDSPVAGSSKEERSFNIGMIGLMVIVLSVLIYLFVYWPSQSANYNSINGLVEESESIPDIYFGISTPEVIQDLSTYELLSKGNHQLTDLLRIEVNESNSILTTGKQSLKFQTEGVKLVYKYITLENIDPPSTIAPNNSVRVTVTEVEIIVTYDNNEFKVWLKK